MDTYFYSYYGYDDNGTLINGGCTEFTGPALSTDDVIKDALKYAQEENNKVTNVHIIAYNKI